MPPSRREDLSRFLVHLTRDYDNKTACENLIAIVRDKKIEARNPHCLFKHEITRLGFSSVLTKAFHTVCLTETPLTQIHRLTGAIKGRQIELQGYGLVFNKNDLIAPGASAAIYLNAKGTKLRDYLRNRFREDFNGITKLKTLAQQEQEHYGSIIQDYALINIIADHHHFTWEREWRHSGPLPFKYRDLVAIVAPDPNSFADECRPQLPRPARKYLEMIPPHRPNMDVRRHRRDHGHKNLGRRLQANTMMLPRTEHEYPQRLDLAVEQGARLATPTDGARSAIVISRAELFGPEMELVLFRRLQPALPAAMDDVPSHDPAYRELRLLLGRIKKLRIDPKHSTRPFHDYAIIYCGWQHSRDGRRRIILLEGLSALGTTGAAKAFCQTSIPACLTDVQDYFLVHHTTLDLGTAGQNNARCCATPKKQRVAAVLPWNWEDVVVGEIKYVQAVAPLARSG